MRRRAAAAAAPLLAAALALTACAETIDLRDRDDATTPADAAAVTSEPLPLDGDLDALLPALLASWRGLDQRVIDGEAADPMARIETAWAAAEPLVRADHPTSLHGMQQAVNLARSAVERRRPADASKGYRLAIEVTDEILSR